ncbi:IS6 family transposase domain protein (plasmid) [Candidatus Trichorickettsia mobilis]|uniref:DDE-type integrase/transposase/recombinase n=1 Tax=Candidatus Trichorickettsia mobilis TaxID=1346319 RepID=UPI002B25872E|nr:DDE-type integrase/transposase/recombinase [Candidatus Trichorickettsia mobilis]WPY01913.1 IS6 family transposase domain protein [Candidatus Trichorickettsia mobilis]
MATVDSDGYKLEVLLQKRRNKKAAIRFLTKLLGNYQAPRVIITDKLKSYQKPILYMCPKTDHRSHKGLNNRAENAHQPTRRKEKVLIKFKSPHGVQRTLSLMGKVRIYLLLMSDDIQKMLKNSELLFLLLNQSEMRLPQGFLLSEIYGYRTF